MKCIKIFYVSIILIAMTLVACQDPATPVQDAVKVTKSELKNEIGYTWFWGYYNLYEPKDSIMNLIPNYFIPDSEKFVVFIEPSCTCRPTNESPADLIKVLDSANITESKYEIYSMSSKNSKHPYLGMMKIETLPAAFLFKNGKPVYSVLDSLKYWVDRDNSKVEKIVLESLEQNK
jgi:hypothetical protein